MRTVDAAETVCANTELDACLIQFFGISNNFKVTINHFLSVS